MTIRHALIALASLTGAVAAVPPRPAAAVDVPISEVTFALRPLPQLRTTGHDDLAPSDDGTRILGVPAEPYATLLGSPYAVLDTITDMVTPVPSKVLSGDGRHYVDASFAVRTLDGAVDWTPPALPAPWTPSLPDLDRQGMDAISADGSVLALPATRPPQAGQRTKALFLVRKGSNAVVDLGGALPAGDTDSRTDKGMVSRDGLVVVFEHVNFAIGCNSLRNDTNCYRKALHYDIGRATVDAVMEDVVPEELSSDGRVVGQFVSLPGYNGFQTRDFLSSGSAGFYGVNVTPVPGGDDQRYVSMSGDAQIVVYRSDPPSDGIVHLRLLSGIVRPIVPCDGAACPSLDPVVSGDGRRVVYGTADGRAFLADVETPRVMAVAPNRLLDSRAGQTDTVPNVAGGTVLQVQVSGSGTTGIARGTRAAVLNITVTNASRAGFVTVWDCNGPMPTASNLNYEKGQTVANAVVTGLSAFGLACVYVHTAADVIVDAGTGFGPAAGHRPVAPVRVLDTRVDENPATPPSVAAGSMTTLDVRSLAALPDDVASVSLNVTVTKAAGAGFVTVFPCVSGLPTASNLNYEPGQTVANAVVTTLPASGGVCLFSSNAVDLIVDVNGGFTASAVFTQPPVRAIDTRNGETDTVPNVPAGGVVVVDVGRAPMRAAIVNVTATNTAAAGFLTVYPCDGELPVASNLNYRAGQTVPNLAVSAMSASGTICVYTHAAADIVVDLTAALVP